MTRIGHEGFGDLREERDFRDLREQRDFRDLSDSIDRSLYSL
jgi:hypothetical protein